MTKNLEIKDYAKDIRLNISSALKPDLESDLKQDQIAFIALSCSYATKNIDVVNHILENLSQDLSEAQINAAKSCASIMAMNNIYYRFVHLVDDIEYASMPAKLRMNIIANPGIDKTDFELSALAVSTINGCGLCIDSHVKQLTNSGISKKTIAHAVRISSIINASAQAAFIN